MLLNNFLWEKIAFLVILIKLEQNNNFNLKICGCDFGILINFFRVFLLRTISIYKYNFIFNKYNKKKNLK